MKILKTIALAAICMFAMNVSAQERQKMDPQQMAQRQTANIKAHVTGITADQEAKILAIEQDFANAVQDARNNSNGDRDAMHAKMQTLRADKDAKLKAVMTADQYTQYQTLEKSHQRGGNRGGQ